MKIALVVGVALGLTAGAAAAAAQAPDGEVLYRQQCRACHGTTGAPPQRMRTLYKTLPTLDSTFLAARSDDSLVAVLRNGIGRDMKSYKDKLTPEQMRAVAKYVRTFATAAPKAP